jgi:uncharacterized membrane protein YjdF
VKNPFQTRRFTTFVFLTFIGSAVFVVGRIMSAPTSPVSAAHIRVKSDYTLMLLQCILGALAMILPGFFQRKIQLNIPSMMVVVYAVFLYCAIYLGEVHSFYYRVPQWDSILHAFSGMALCTIGFSIIGLLNKSESVPLSLSPAFVALFAFCFAVSIGAIWEIYEFSADYLLHTNMQKYALESGELLAGQVAIADTMKDLIIDTVGALGISASGYILSKDKHVRLDKVQIKHYHSGE